MRLGMKPWDEDQVACLRMSNTRERRLGPCKRVSNKRQGMIQKYIFVPA